MLKRAKILNVNIGSALVLVLDEEANKTKLLTDNQEVANAYDALCFENKREFASLVEQENNNFIRSGYFE